MTFARFAKRCRAPLLAAAATLVCGLAPFAVAPAGAAGAYPSRPIRVVIPYPPGGGTDVIGRIIAHDVSARLGQSVVIENRAGAGGNLGAELVAKSAPDGYTLLFTPQGPITIAGNFDPKPPYDPARDFAPVAKVALQPILFAVNARVPAKTLPEFLALAKTEPGKLNYGSAGVGTEMHLTGELLKLESGANFTHIPYRGGGPAITDLVAGQIQMMVVVYSSIEPYIKNGDVRALATTNGTRLPELPNVPTTAEDGLPQVDVVPWWGFFVPNHTPADAVSAWVHVLEDLSKEPAYIQSMAKLGAETTFKGPADFARELAAERARWHDVILKAHLKLN